MSGKKITREFLLIVEGKDEENFFGKALKHLGLSDSIQILPVGGKILLTQNLLVLKNDPRFGSVKAIAVVRDSDTNARGARDAVRGALQAITQNPPPEHAQFAPGSPRTGFFLVPDGDSDGMLETLCMRAAQDEAGAECVGSYFRCMEMAGVPLPVNMHKARAHAWLASRTEPDKRVGEAALAGYWNFDHHAFAPLWQFLRGMVMAGE